MQSPFSLEGKTILVTGAAGTGIGAGVCAAIVEAGGRVVVNARTQAAAEAAAARLPGNQLIAVGDISSEANVLALFATLEDQGIVLDGLVNNAGVGLSTPSHLASSAQFDHLYGVDIRGLWLMTRGFVNQLLPAGRPGAVVNVSSVHAHSTIGQYALYAGVKGAVEAYTRGAAVELGPHGIRVNAISPGYVHAEQNNELIASWATDAAAWVHDHTHNQQALRREIRAIDCGRTTVFLLSEAACAITGQSLGVDAGSTCMIYPNDFVPVTGKWTK